MIKLFDVQRREYAGEFDNAEDAIRMAGAMLSYLGVAYFENRYSVIRPNEQMTYAEVIYNQEQTTERAYAYVDEDIYKRQEYRSHRPRQSVYLTH